VEIRCQQHQFRNALAERGLLWLFNSYDWEERGIGRKKNKVGASKKKTYQRSEKRSVIWEGIRVATGKEGRKV